MAQPARITRRTFVGGTAVTAASLAFVRGDNLSAALPSDTPGFPATDHFWYRPQPAGVFVDSQCDNWAFAYADGRIMLSEDNGHTWPYSAAFADARQIVFSCIFRNGNVLFSARARLYLSTDRLKTYEPIVVKNGDGSDFIPHTPKNPAHPGWYFHSLTGVNTFDVQGTEMLVWGNYCNVIDGAAPVHIYYSTDQGRSVKVAYSFGQNPFIRDDGSPGGGDTGTLLGDPKNPAICRHVHDVCYNPVENAFYACTGDRDREQGYECHWLRGTYDLQRDVWDWRVIISDAMNSRYKCGGINFVDGRLYWISDSNGREPYDRGVFSCDPADLADLTKHTRLFNPGVESGNMIIQDGVILASHCAPASTMATGFIISLDMGKTWAQYDLAEFGRRSPCRFHRKNGDGWFRVDLRSEWVTPAEMMFIKPKPA
jgi:hypothetical protein